MEAVLLVLLGIGALAYIIWALVKKAKNPCSFCQGDCNHCSMANLDVDQIIEKNKKKKAGD